MPVLLFEILLTGLSLFVDCVIAYTFDDGSLFIYLFFVNTTNLFLAYNSYSYFKTDGGALRSGLNREEFLS